jgi:hypothetical protein
MGGVQVVSNDNHWSISSEVCCLCCLGTSGKQLRLLVTEIIEEWALASVGQSLLKGSNWMYAYPKTEASKG